MKLRRLNNNPPDISEVKDRLAGKELIGYGAGWATLATMGAAKLELSYVVDDNPELQGQTIMGVPIKPPSYLTTANKETSFVIAFAYVGRAVRAIQERLRSMGFQYLHNWVDCSCLHYATIGRRLYDRFGIEPDPELFAKTRMLSLYGPVENWSAIAGTWLFAELLNKIQRTVPGNIAEMGVYQGGNAFISLFLLGSTIRDRTYHLFDSFSGFPRFSPHDPQSRSAEFADVSISFLESLFCNFQNARLNVGLFSETLKAVSSEKFAMVYVDCDLYESTLQCCEFFYDRLNPGSVMLFHDYCEQKPGLPIGTREPFTAVKKAADEFFSEMPEEILEFPETTHALVVKQ
jgi:O-methyltransferase